jgi:hypothetical protein
MVRGGGGRLDLKQAARGERGIRDFLAGLPL